MSKSSTGRVDKLRQKAKDKGWKRREYYATPEEHEGLRLALDALRKGAPFAPATTVDEWRQKWTDTELLEKIGIAKSEQGATT